MRAHNDHVAALLLGELHDLGPGPALSHDCGDVRDPQVAQLLRGGVELLLHHGPFGLLDALRGVRRHLEGRTAAPEDVGDRVEHLDDGGVGRQN